jgi:ferredoxin-NADP reductase/hemoglobin-like flavoprotein
VPERTTEKQDAYADFDTGADPDAETALATDAAQWAQEDLIAEIRASFALIEPHGTEAAAWFYEHLFAANPRYRKYFSADPAGQHLRLFHAMQRIVGDLDRLDDFLSSLRRLALRHRKFGLRAAHYQAFGVSLLAAVAKYCGPQWTERTNAAWEAGYGLVANVMLEAAAEADRTMPPYWETEVVAHELLTDGIARIALRPFEDGRQPASYEFRAGQYAAVETAAQPRVWRDFSFAGAPGNGEIEFHVRIEHPGGVSDALVNKTAVGDRVRVAQAEGELAFPEPDRAQRLLAVAHGTGAAPVRALIEAAVASGGKRPVTVILVSDEGPHYLAESLRALAQEHGDLTVEEVLGDPLTAVRVHAAAAGPGGTCGAVLVGPNAMVEQWRAALTAAGIDEANVSCDLFD